MWRNQPGKFSVTPGSILYFVSESIGWSEIMLDDATIVLATGESEPQSQCSRADPESPHQMVQTPDAEALALKRSALIPLTQGDNQCHVHPRMYPEGPTPL